MKIQTIKAKQISYSNTNRDRNTVKYIVIHNTGNKGDLATGNARYFAGGNTRAAGAHFFIDHSGEIIKSVPLNRAAWSVGGNKYNNNGGKYYKIVTNSNSVSIELCDIVDRDPSPAMIKAIKQCIKYIRKYCPNAKTVIRHYDVNGKPCPIRYVNAKKWADLKKKIGE